MALRVIGGEVTAYVGLIDIMLLRDVKIKSRAENSKKISGFCNEIFFVSISKRKKDKKLFAETDCLRGRNKLFKETA